MLMANSVGGPLPVPRPDVVEFANRLPARHKLCGLDEKHLLKRAFEDLVPEQIRRRPKQPYRAPDAASFFSGAPPEWLTEVTSPAALAAAGVFDPRPVAGAARQVPRAPAAYGWATPTTCACSPSSRPSCSTSSSSSTRGRRATTHHPQPMTVIDRVQHVRSTA